MQTKFREVLLIVKFLELSLEKDQKEFPNYYLMTAEFNPDNLTRCNLESMDYNFRNSWSWLMPVLEKICRKRVGDGKEYVEYPHPRTFGMIDETSGDFMVRLNGCSLFTDKKLISCLFKAIIDFLVWLEQNPELK